MKMIGITGGVGSGKSRVLSYIEETFDCVICQADHVAWDLQKPGEKGYLEIVKHFGNGILNEDGTICRPELGKIVFSDEKELEVLNGIMHPAVKEAIREKISVEAKKGTRLFVLEAALLIEDHYDVICDEMWYIHTDASIRAKRLKETRGYDEERIAGIMANQKSPEEFRSECDAVIDNSGDLAYTYEQIDKQLGR